MLLIAPQPNFINPLNSSLHLSATVKFTMDTHHVAGQRGANRNRVHARPLHLQSFSVYLCLIVNKKDALCVERPVASIALLYMWIVFQSHKGHNLSRYPLDRVHEVTLDRWLGKHMDNVYNASLTVCLACMSLNRVAELDH